MIEVLPKIDTVELSNAKQAWLELTEQDRIEFHAWAKSILFSDRYKKQHIPSSLRWEIFKNDGMRCFYCGASEDLTVDHLIPESLGGGLEKENLVTACRCCNSEKGTSNFLQFSCKKLLPILADLVFQIKSGQATKESLGLSVFLAQNNQRLLSLHIKITEQSSQKLIQ